MNIKNTSDLPFNLRVNMGWYANMSVQDKFGLNSLITPSSDPEDIWEGGGTYNFSNTADIVSLASNNGGDLVDIEIDGLDVDGLQVSQTIKLDGNNRVALTTPLLRVSRMQNQGDVTVRAIIVNGNNQTQMAIYTIPKDKVAFLYRGEFGMEFEGSQGSGTNFARCTYRSRRPGEVFKVKKTITLINQATSVYKDSRSFPDVIPGMTDVKLVCEEVSDDIGIWGTLDLLLVDADSFPADYLAAIGQPT